MRQERTQAERLQALLEALESASKGEEEGDELLELAALAAEIRHLKADRAGPILGAERRSEARKRALGAFGAHWESSERDRELIQLIHEAVSRHSKDRPQSRRKPKPDRTLEASEQPAKLQETLHLGRRQLLKMVGLAGLWAFFRGFFVRAYSASPAPGPVASSALGETPLRAVTVKRVLSDPQRKRKAFVMLLEAAQDKTLPIWIGAPEATAISFSLEGKSLPRPLTHDLLLSALEAVGAHVDHVRITHREDQTYYASIVLRDREGEVRTIDARPSDAVALAMRASCPIYASEEVIEESAIELASRARSCLES